MSEAIAINITKIEHCKELPKCETHWFLLINGETIETALERFENTYQRLPTQGWYWGSYLVLQKEV